ncbi:sensor histidine kinase [Leucobacter triazinivorans]|uniref:Histidine kinase/HSP90-like ATPase domain-containing protein n=1 Tax=Leucobacter triazinivorans TaxID=1784719 RepID=A0A4P6KGB2_9MICO|nr:ATP-binding protein [Leucobacter triazinivorans]QBE49270.1 hypothetical protein EVS81_10845 [Leucobacter triazinivorans]
MRPDRHATERADRQTGWLIALCALVFLSARAGLAVAQADDFAPWWTVAAGTAACAFIGLAVFGRRIPMRFLTFLWLAVPALVLTLQFLSYGAYRVPGGSALPWVWSLEAAAVSLLVLVLRTPFVFAITVLSGLSVALSAWVFTGSVPTAVAEATPPHVSNVAFVAIFLGIRGRLAALHESEARTREAAARSAQVDAENMRRTRLGRVVHDEVLSVLTAATMLRGSIPDVLRDEAKRALVVLDAARTEPEGGLLETEPALAQLQQHLARVAPEAAFAARGDGSPMPASVFVQVSSAIVEALRNAKHHSGAERIAIEVSISDGGIEAVVRDDGIGLSPAVIENAAVRGRMGVAHSIVGRMSEIGGRAEVQSSPGTGTEVQLTWRP